jgi:lipopolysaccharide export system protein LptA
VEIHQASSGRTRTGSGEHGEYYVDEQKVILRGSPKMVDSGKGDFTGDELIYYADDDRLIVNGSKDKPAVSHMKQKGH